jgi:hypothetical protein
MIVDDSGDTMDQQIWEHRKLFFFTAALFEDTFVLSGKGRWQKI